MDKVKALRAMRESEKRPTTPTSSHRISSALGACHVPVATRHSALCQPVCPKHAAATRRPIAKIQPARVLASSPLRAARPPLLTG